MSKLKSWRETKGWSQAKLGEQVGVSSVAIGRYEAGRVPEPPVLQKLIDISEGQVTANDWFELPAQEDAA
jgi:transcriptional regulator with XRE-family HTH domain